MSESLGLSIGVANLVAARVGSAPVTRGSVLTLFEHRPTEIGLPEENPNLTEPGLVLRGFVERVGDRAPLVAADGTKYLGAALTVEAIEAMARTTGYGTPVTIAVPAYWSDAQSAALREEFFAQPDSARQGTTVDGHGDHDSGGLRRRRPAIPHRIRATHLRTAGPIRRYRRRYVAGQRNSAAKPGCCSDCRRRCRHPAAHRATGGPPAG